MTILERGPEEPSWFDHLESRRFLQIARHWVGRAGNEDTRDFFGPLFFDAEVLALEEEPGRLILAHRMNGQVVGFTILEQAMDGAWKRYRREHPKTAFAGDVVAGVGVGLGEYAWGVVTFLGKSVWYTVPDLVDSAKGNLARPSDCRSPFFMLGTTVLCSFFGHSEVPPPDKLLPYMADKVLSAEIRDGRKRRDTQRVVAGAVKDLLLFVPVALSLRGGGGTAGLSYASVTSDGFTVAFASSRVSIPSLGIVTSTACAAGLAISGQLNPNVHFSKIPDDSPPRTVGRGGQGTAGSQAGIREGLPTDLESGTWVKLVTRRGLRLPWVKFVGFTGDGRIRLQCGDKTLSLAKESVASESSFHLARDVAVGEKYFMYNKSGFVEEVTLSYVDKTADVVRFQSGTGAVARCSIQQLLEVHQVFTEARRLATLRIRRSLGLSGSGPVLVTSRESGFHIDPSHMAKVKAEERVFNELGFVAPEARQAFRDRMSAEIHEWHEWFPEEAPIDVVLTGRSGSGARIDGSFRPPLLDEQNVFALEFSAAQKGIPLDLAQLENLHALNIHNDTYHQAYATILSGKLQRQIPRKQAEYEAILEAMDFMLSKPQPRRKITFTIPQR